MLTPRARERARGPSIILRAVEAMPSVATGASIWFVGESFNIVNIHRVVEAPPNDVAVLISNEVATVADMTFIASPRLAEDITLPAKTAAQA